MPLGRSTKTLLAVLGGATIVHAAAVLGAPRLIMHILISRVAAQAGLNRELHGPRVTSDMRTVVMPSPDLLYTICAFDVTERPIRVTARVPPTYFSISLFDARTDNFFVINDRALAGGRADLVVTSAGRRPNGVPAGATLVESPSARGVVLFRMLIGAESDLEGLLRFQQEARCAPL